MEDDGGVPANGKVSPLDSPAMEPGSIVRLKMINFLTYSEIEYFLGDSLNMIIGPNGTGKSSFVCAVCLGLGGKPEILGRAKDIKDFVKTGKKSGSVEIELQGPRGERNPVITRVINIDGSGSYALNGRKVPYKTIVNLVDSFNIQISNLCQFLPQEKVARFAQSSPQELLIDTERAIGARELVEKHEELIALAKKRDEYSQSVEADREQLKRLQETYERQAGEIQYLEEVENMKTELARYEVLVPFARFAKWRLLLNSAKAEKRNLEAQLSEYEEKHKSVSVTLAEAESRQMESFKSFNLARNELRKLEQQYERLLDKHTTGLQNLETMKRKLQGISSEQKKYKDSITDGRAKVKIIEEELEKYTGISMDEEKLQGIISKLAQLKAQLRSLNSEASRHKESKDSELQNCRRLEAFRSQEENALRHLNELPHRQLEAFRRLGNLGNEVRDAATAVQYLREHVHELGLDHEVFEPPVFSLDLVDQKCAHIVSGAFSRRLWLTFTCQSRSDYRKLSAELVDRRRLKVYLTEYSATGQHPLAEPRPIPERDFSKYGIDGYVIDLLSGPEKVLNMLAFEGNMHKIPYSRNSLQRRQVEMLSGLCYSNGALMVSRFLDRNSMFQNTKSQYGKRAVTSMAEPFGPLTPFLKVKTETVDNSAEIEATRTRIEDYNSQIQDSRDKVLEAQREIDSIRWKLSEIQESISTLSREKKKFDDMEVKKSKLQTRLANAKNELKQTLDRRPDFDQQRSKLKDSLSELTAQILELSGRLTSCVDAMVKLETDCVEYSLRSFVSKNEATQLSELVEMGRVSLAVKVRQVEETIRSLTAQTEQFKKENSTLSKEERIKINADLDGKSEEKLQELINSLKAKLALTDQTGDVARKMRAFEELKQQIAVLESRLDENDNLNANVNEDIAKIRSTWEPELERLISIVDEAFSKEFESIQCRGRVFLVKERDSFKDWRIEIKVSFRAEEELQLLTGQRQSGGERAVSTILYLMSLQSLAKAPFRVVDEINQGMDPRNERMVHGRMVDVACQENTAQYFLITPKLLTDLPYHSRMKISCIFSGPNVAKMPGRAVTTQKILENSRRVAMEE